MSSRKNKTSLRKKSRTPVTQNKKKQDQMLSINTAALNNVSKSIQLTNNNNDGIIQLFPDVAVVMDVVEANVLSAEDMTTTTLVYSSKSKLLANSCKSALSIVASSYVDSIYNITDNLKSVIREGLFTRGAYAMLTVSIDTSVELARAAKLPRTSYTFEDTTEVEIMASVEEKTVSTTIDAVDEELSLEFTTDTSLLVPEKAITVTTEDNSSNISDIVKEFIALRPDRGVIEGCIRTKIPVEAVMPITMPNDPSDHLGYFILLDKMHKVVKTSVTDVNAGLKAKLLGDNTLLKKARSNLGMITSETPNLALDESIYINILRDKLSDKLSQLDIAETGAFELNNDFFKVLMLRSLRKLKTKVMYVSAEQLTYYAFNYRDNGTGESLVERVAVLASMRGIAKMTRNMANVRNSIPNTKYSATLPEEDLDPLATTEAIMTEAMSSNASKMPLGSSNITDLLNWVVTAGISVHVQSPAIPDLTIESEEVYTNYDASSIKDLEEDLRGEMIVALGSSVDIIDGVSEENFAAKVIANNALRRRKTLSLQKTLAKFITRDIKAISVADPGVLRVLKEEIKERYREFYKPVPKELKASFRKSRIPKADIITWMAEEYMETMNITFPTFTVDSNQGLNESFKTHKENVEVAIESWFSEEMLPEELRGDDDDESISKLDEIKTALLHTLLREWMITNKYIPELTDGSLFEDEDGNPRIYLLDKHEEYTDNLVISLKAYLTRTGVLDTDGKEEDDDNDDDYSDYSKEPEPKEPKEDVEPKEPEDDDPGDMGDALMN